ncbi:divergent PAP2 family protein [Paenibacillus sp. MZ04-78.2]|uniref:divergent PAP2 family protein n=1 Tax=Paenibacillus sp. MZ04-78.2 TaxID=2962034 RepID=UPI0020B828F2|nr:divergent PAP2 family protein [Paenibacillus sp. MZ04-78.2]MCP3774579.1 divergent PAP2 family protein [Paenibacillus sp. MZ04-78.2]
MPYYLAPLVAWVCSGTIKFMINYIRFKNEAGKLIGNGGFPSTHTTVIATPTILIAINEGVNSPIFGLGLAVLLIIMFDASGLRIQVGKHSQFLNNLAVHLELVKKDKLRERMGHTKIEILGGLLLGLIIAILFYITFG